MGTLERIQYPPAGIVKFARMQAQGLLPIYANDEVTIYELVDPVEQCGGVAVLES